MIPIPDFTEQELQKAHANYLKEMLENPNNLSFWYPKVKDCEIRQPRTVIVPVDEETMNSQFLERPGDEERIEAFIKDKVMPAIPQDMNDLFVKNGCFSNKFDFSQCHIGKNPHALLLSFTRINYDSLCFDTMGNSEFIIREYIRDFEPDVPTYRIYNGMPLRPEFRIFHDFDRKKSLYAANYWDWDYCHDRICEDPTDELAYEAAYPHIKETFEQKKDEAMQTIEKAFANVEGMQGIWSADLMWTSQGFVLIDMALGHRSTYWNPEKTEP